jgi:eukaryotic-like serine/threonine-protein kinase
VIGSYGIAAAQYLDIAVYATAPPWAGLSWVAVWMLGFTVIIPSPPRWALLAALGSASAVPVVAGVAMATAPSPVAITPLRFFLLIVVPYWLVVLIAFVGAHLVHRLGAELKRARQLGAYRLVERLGQGGMGEVWRARHRFLVRPAAVKLIRVDVRQAHSHQLAELQARFEREAQATASLRSPHTIQLYDFGVAEGTFYYVMELLDGFDLEKLVDAFGPMPVERAVHVLTQVCHSLAEAHAEGLVHRDIKPSNVFVCRYGRDVDFVKVLDFGLVKTLDANSDIAVTVEHTLRGTPAFMAPEQVLGTQPVDGRSDIYALGCLAYWLVTGQMVFTGRTAMETITQHTHSAPVPPSVRTELEIPEAFDRVVLTCLDKRPDMRPATAAILAQQLRAINTGRSWTPDVAAAWWNAHYPRASGP